MNHDENKYWLWRWLRNLDELERLDEERRFRESEAVEMTNLWWMACECVGIKGSASGGKFRDALKRLKQSSCRKFTVTDGEKEGTCYAFHDHFDVWWKDGSTNLGIVELSRYGIREVDTELAT